jgi:protein-disulfide isomerase
MRLDLALVVGATSFVVGFSAVGAFRKPVVTPPAPIAATMSLSPPDPRFVYKVLLQDAPVRGRADALVTVVVFGSYECPRCRETEAALSQIAAAEPLRVVWKDLPSSAGARLAARAARAAGAQGRFWELHDALVSAAGTNDEARVKQLAARLGLDEARFHVAFADAALERAIAADEAQARDFGLGAAPALFVNGRFVPTATLAHLREQIGEARAFAAQLVADGTVPASLYAALMRGALAHSGPISAFTFE